MAADTAELIATLGNLGNICGVSGQREQADAYYREVLSLQKRIGDEGGIGATLVNLGNLRADVGEWDRARAYYLEARDILDRLNDDAALAVLDVCVAQDLVHGVAQRHLVGRELAVPHHLEPVGAF